MKRIMSQPTEPIDYAVDAFAVRGCLTILAGPSGLGKSWLGLLLADGVAQGRAVAGIDCTQGRSLYFDAENGQRILKQRFEAAAIPPHDSFGVIDVDGADLTNQADRTQLERLIHEDGATFVVLDALKTLTPTARENENDEMAPIIGGLQKIARRTNAAILLLHHQSVKDGSASFRGASAIQDQTDMLFSMRSTNGRFILLRAEKFRVDKEPDDRAIELVTDAGIVSVEPTGGTASKSAEPKMIDRLLALAQEIQANGGVWRRRRIAERLGCHVSDNGSVPGTLATALNLAVEKHGWGRVPGKGYRPCAAVPVP